MYVCTSSADGRTCADDMRYALGTYTSVRPHLCAEQEGARMELTSPRLVGFKAKAALCTPARLLAVWTELVRRHAPLGACVEYSGEGTAKFV
jgi:hypothetical protein